jgi:lipoprotein NlpI
MTLTTGTPRLRSITPWGLACLVGLLLLALPVNGQTKGDALAEAKRAVGKGDFTRALNLCNEALKRDPKSHQAYFLRGEVHEKQGKNQEALADFSKVLELNPANTEVYHARGCVQFKLGNFNESVADFDKYLEIDPKRKPSHWQRGISCYYAGKYDEGKQQFEGYQNFDSNDVENAVWRFMCQAKKDDIAQCRKDMLKIGSDQRVPMKEVYDLFMGKLEPKDVLAAAKDRKMVRDQDSPLFYAHLYVGLYFETMGDKKQALEHLNKATEDYAHRRYMWDVARVHRDVLRAELEKK